MTLPPLSYSNFFDTEINETLKESPLRKFSALWDKIFSTENLDNPPPLLSINFFATGLFPEHSTEGFTYEFFRHCETKKFRQKIENRDITLWSIKFCGTRNERNTKGFPLPNLSTLWDKKIDGKSWYPFPPLLCIKFFATRNFLIHRSVPQRIFLVLCDKKFWTKGKVVHRIWKSVVELMFVEKFRKIDFKQ